MIDSSNIIHLQLLNILYLKPNHSLPHTPPWPHHGVTITSQRKNASSTRTVVPEYDQDIGHRQGSGYVVEIRGGEMHGVMCIPGVPGRATGPLSPETRISRFETFAFRYVFGFRHGKMLTRREIDVY
jgi:hypothetical protein